MMPAAKMMDPVLGVDIHIVQPPGPVPPVPIPHPFIGLLFDPMELAPFIGASVLVNGMPKATAGSEGKALPPHIPIGGVFAPPPPGNECEMFMGSATVLFEGEPASYLALPALSCQSIGIPAPFRPKKKPKPILKLPTSIVLPIPAGPPVLIGGPPTISMSVIGMKLAMGAAMKAAGKLRKMMKASKKAKAVSDRVHKAAKKAMDKLGVPPSAQNKVHKGICTVTGHPVDVATGKVFTDNVDFEIPGPIPLRWERTWYSCSTYEGPLGHGWHHSYDMALAETENAVAVRLRDGRAAAFPKIAPAGEYFDRREKLTLLRDALEYVLRDKSGLAYHFPCAPSTKSVSPLAKITDRSGNSIRFHYDADGCLDAIQDSHGRIFMILKDGAGRILRILAPHPDIQDATFPIVAYRYDDAGDMVETRDALGQSWTYSYRQHLLARETNRNGLTFRFEYDGNGHGARCLRTWGDGGIYDHRLAYDLEKRRTSVTDSTGATTTYHWSESGLVGKVECGPGIARSMAHNAFNELEKETDELGLETGYAYDDRGNRIRVSRPDGSVLEIEYDGDVPIAAKDPLGGEWKWQHDERRRLTCRVDPLGRKTLFAYEGGRLASITDPAGRETRMRYSESGVLIALLSGGKPARSWEVDRLGRRRTAIDADGNVQRKSFDLLNRVTKVEGPFDGSLEFRYDGEGNILHAKDGARSVSFTYSGMNRISSRIEQGRAVTYEYDTEERLIAVRNELGEPLSYELDRHGRVVTEIGFGGGRTVYRRDRKGRVVHAESAGGRSWRKEYDAADRVRKVEYSDGEIEEYAYRPDGLLAAASNSSMRVAFDRDPLGRVVLETQGEHSVATEYDVLGRRLSVRSSLGGSQAFGYEDGDLGLDMTVSADREVSAWSIRFSRDSLGRESERILPGGIKSLWIRDAKGLPIRHGIVTPRGFHAREYGWDGNGRINSISDNRTGFSEYGYDAFGGLAWSRSDDDRHQARWMDEIGNPYRSPERRDRSYSPAGRLEEASGADGTTRFEYDPGGFLIRKHEPGGKTWSYEWNAAGMLAKVIRPDGQVVEFAYDPFGRRISKTFRGQTVRWVWNGNTPLHEWCEESASQPLPDRRPPPAMAGESAMRNSDSGTRQAPVTWFFEPGGYSPIAKSVGNRFYSILTDHIGCPLSMFDSEGRETWSGRMDIYGKVATQRGGTGDCPFRFPGQYEDPETGLFYNRFRYYSPDEGLFISPDPLASVSTRTYAFVKDVLRSFDVFGLMDPWDIQFSQDSIDDKFLQGPWAGRSLEEAIEETRELGRLPEGLELNVQEMNGGRDIVTLNNRTLYVAQQANLPQVHPNFVGAEGDNQMRKLLDGKLPLPVGEQPRVRTCPD